MEDFESFLRRASNYKNNGQVEYYEDTHVDGKYVGSNFYGAPAPASPSASSAAPNYTPPPSASSDAARRTEQELGTQYKVVTDGKPQQQQQQPVIKKSSLPNLDDGIANRTYSNIAVLTPRDTADAQKLIDYLRRRETAIINLNPIVNDPMAQRVLDFISGATYALGGGIVKISEGYIFLIKPDGVNVIKQEDE